MPLCMTQMMLVMLVQPCRFGLGAPSFHSPLHCTLADCHHHGHSLIFYLCSLGNPLAILWQSFGNSLYILRLCAEQPDKAVLGGVRVLMSAWPAQPAGRGQGCTLSADAARATLAGRASATACECQHTWQRQPVAGSAGKATGACGRPQATSRASSNLSHAD